MAYLGSRYELIEFLGSGAMGEVWRARVRPDAPAGGPPDVPEALAVKLLHESLVQDPDVVRRFVQERSILMGLRHPGIVRVVDMVAEGDKLGIVMELVPGGTLGDALKKRRTLAPAVAVPVSCAVLDALAYAHGRGVLHRDVKPANVLLGEDGLGEPSAVKLGDFGIASFMDEQGAHATGLVGSPAFMPPEQFTAGVVSAASDVYATGIMLYEMLAGRTPFAGHGSVNTVGFRHVTLEPPRLPIDDELWGVVAAMLAKTPGDRPAAADAAAALRGLSAKCLQAQALPVQPEPRWEAQSSTGSGATGSGSTGGSSQSGVSTSWSKARLEVTNPRTTGAQLQAIAAEHRDLWNEVAKHPNAYPGLLDWLDSVGDEQVRTTIARRRSRGVEPTVLAPAFNMEATAVDSLPSAVYTATMAYPQEALSGRIGPRIEPPAYAAYPAAAPSIGTQPRNNTPLLIGVIGAIVALIVAVVLVGVLRPWDKTSGESDGGPGGVPPVTVTVPASGGAVPGYDYANYFNQRFGYSVDYPTALTAEPAPADGSGMTWSSSQGNVTFAVRGFNTSNGDEVQQVTDDLEMVPPAGAVITYHDSGMTSDHYWGVVSGHTADGSRTFYTFETVGPGSGLYISWWWDSSATWVNAWMLHSYDSLHPGDRSVPH